MRTRRPVDRMQPWAIPRVGPGTNIAYCTSMRAVIADDDAVTTTVLSRALERLGFEVAVAHDGESAWQLLTTEPTPALAVVDWMMPGIDGTDLCRRVRLDPSLSSLYVILLTGRGSRGDLVAGLDAGADDYMVKPIDTEELRARVQVGMRVANLQRRLGEQVAELQATRDHLARLVSTDELTEVYSRRSWFDLAATEFQRSRRYGRALSLMILDLDFFKRVNDTYGHDAGDRLLRSFADMLRAECRQPDLVGRLGGEEFAILVPETPPGAAQHHAARLCDGCGSIRLAEPHADIRCSCSIGISAMRPEDDDLESMLRRADEALYEAKRSGRNCWRVSEPVGAPRTTARVRSAKDRAGRDRPSL
jgi:two-component system, cell cycle response regulator